MSAVNLLPDYMKIYYRALLNLYEEFEKEMTKQGRSYSVCGSKNVVCPFHGLKRTIISTLYILIVTRIYFVLTHYQLQELARSYYVEAKWFNEGYVPSFDEYMGNALNTAGYSLLTTSSFVGMGEIGTTEAFDWIKNKPKILVASCTIVRLMDDIVDYEEEQERGHFATGIICYMKEHAGMSIEEVTSEFNRRIENAWKDINEECLKPNSISMNLLRRIVNLTRLMDVLFKNGDGYTHPEKEWKDHIVSTFIDPIPV
ncbi:valerianol synthase TPS1B-like [Cornus florida]|uniref:valerianol synthase TPS1B-like n=1 Tax=Cornus florida TaxID=4283 RepID=UPI00289C9E18|nr:valerianol synthase TPS1B-like [Cornus florida]